MIKCRECKERIYPDDDGMMSHVCDKAKRFLAGEPDTSLLRESAACGGFVSGKILQELKLIGRTKEE